MCIVCNLVYVLLPWPGESAVPTERGPVSSWSWFSMPHVDCGGKYCNQFKGDVSGHVSTFQEVEVIECSRHTAEAAATAATS